MATISFMMDDEEGHLFPTFRLAHSLAERGHEIRYLSVADNEEYIRQQGFRFHPIFENIYPKGYKKIFQDSRHNQVRQIRGEGPKHIYDHLDEMMKDTFADFISRVNSDLFVVCGYLDIEALLLFYKFGIRPVMFSPCLWEPHTDLVHSCATSIMGDNDLAIKLLGYIDALGVKVNTLEEFIRPFSLFPELIACNRELDIRDHPIDRVNVHYIGPSIRKNGGNGAKNQDNGKDPATIDPRANKKIIYATLGSQTQMYGAICQSLYSKLMNIMTRPEMLAFHLIISTGNEITEDQLPPKTANVTLAKWVQQTEVLDLTSIAVTHGGLGTIKECIYYGVPMVVLPVGREQPLNAMRVERCNLGLTGKIEEISEDELFGKIMSVLHNDSIRQDIRKMQQCFYEAEILDAGAAIIENILGLSTLKP